MKVNILGTEYTIEKRKHTDDNSFEKKGIDGYCDRFSRLIVILDLDSSKKWDDELENSKRECEKSTIRHEIVHAFLFESELAENSGGADEGWATNEEIVDWIANQTPKITKAFEEAGAL